MRHRLLCGLVAVFTVSAIAQDEPIYEPKSEREMLELRQKMIREDRAPRVGRLAPPIRLKSLDGESAFDLAAHRDQRPVILFFGSYT